MFDIIFYKNNSESNRLDKNLYLTEQGYISGDLKNSTSIVNPVIIIELTFGINELVVDDSDNKVIDDNHIRVCITRASQLFECNYCYIPIFKRYYYINDIISVRNKLWEIHLSVDVLMTYKDIILNQTALIDRNEFKANPYLIDDEIPCEIERNISITPLIFRSDTIDIGDVDINFWSNSDNLLVAFNIASITPPITGFVDTNTPANITSNGFNQTYLVPIKYVDNFIKRVFNPSNFEARLDSYSNLSEFVKSGIITPFTIEDLYNMYGSSNPEYFAFYMLQPDDDGYIKLQIGGIDVILHSRDDPFGEDENLYPVYKVVRDCKLSCFVDLQNHLGFLSFLDFPPYSNYAVYIPNIGFIDIDCDAYRLGYHYIVLMIDPNTFQCVIYQSNRKTPFDNFSVSSDNEVLEVFNGELGIDIALGRTNNAERALNKQIANINREQSYINTFLNLANGGSNIFGGFHSYLYGNENRGLPSLVGAGVSTGTNLISDITRTESKYKIDTMLANVRKYNPSTNSDSQFAFWLCNYPYIRKSAVSWFKPDNYDHLYGNPLMQTKKLSEVSGFTKVAGVNLEDFSYATDNELSQIKAILLGGVLLP